MKTFNLDNPAFTGCHYVLDVCWGINIEWRPGPCPPGSRRVERGLETSVVTAVIRVHAQSYRNVAEMKVARLGIWLFIIWLCLETCLS